MEEVIYTTIASPNDHVKVIGVLKEDESSYAGGYLCVKIDGKLETWDGPWLWGTFYPALEQVEKTSFEYILKNAEELKLSASEVVFIYNEWERILQYLRKGKKLGFFS